MSAPRDRMDYDVVIVGGGPAGLSAAIRLKQLAAAAGRAVSVCLVEKGSEIGAHILSGAVLDPIALNALIPDWKAKGAPLETEVCDDRLYYLTPSTAIRVPHALLPPAMHNRGAYIGSLSNLCRWLGHQAEALGVEIYPGFAAAELLFGDKGEVAGVITGAFGIAKDGHRKPSYTPGVELRGRYTLFAEGARGSLSQKLIGHFALAKGCAPQKYGLGIKEVWELDPARHQAGLAIHTLGWPLGDATGGGGFVYHWGEGYCAVGLVVHLDYRNPTLSPFEEFQRLKLHPKIKPFLEGGRRIAYGARVVSEGGLQSVPQLAFPGGALIGCAAGFLNLPRIKGAHNAMASGTLAAEAAFDALGAGRASDILTGYENAYRVSAIHRDLSAVRNVKPLWARFGTILGGVLAGFDLWTAPLLGGSLFGTLGHDRPDHATLAPLRAVAAINYPKPDGVFSFDRASSLFLSGTNHAEDQPVHLRLTDPSLPVGVNLPEYGEPAQRYCPAGVFEVIELAGETRLQINAQNCVHCKACDIKDPSRNITWVPPEGGGGPNYSNM